jgi:hypothetical protein
MKIGVGIYYYANGDTFAGMILYLKNNLFQINKLIGIQVIGKTINFMVWDFILFKTEKLLG